MAMYRTRTFHHLIRLSNGLTITLKQKATMNFYTFDVELTDGEIIRDTVCAPSRFVGESIILEMYSAVSINLVSVN